MENWFRIFLLKYGSSIIFIGLLIYSPWVLSAEAKDKNAPSLEEVIPQDPIIQPNIERREIKEGDIDTEDFEVSVFVGIMSIEDFGSNTIIGARFAYHVTEDFFFEGTYAITEAGTTSQERLNVGFQLLTQEEREYTYYNVSIGYNILAGESFFGKNTAFNSQLYLIAGVGNTEFAGDDHFTVNFGAGYRFIAKDWLAFHGDVRDHVFNIDVTGEDKTTHNLEISLGITYFF